MACPRTDAFWSRDGKSPQTRDSIGPANLKSLDVRLLPRTMSKAVADAITYLSVGECSTGPTSYRNNRVASAQVSRMKHFLVVSYNAAHLMNGMFYQHQIHKYRYTVNTTTSTPHSFGLNSSVPAWRPRHGNAPQGVWGKMRAGQHPPGAAPPAIRRSSRTPESQPHDDWNTMPWTHQPRTWIPPSIAQIAQSKRFSTPPHCSDLPRSRRWS